MKKSIVTLVLTLAPAALVAQASASASGSVSASSTASTAPASYSAENRAAIDASFSAAREHNLPQQPIRDRIAEGQAKGASEAQVVLSAQRAESRLEASQQAMIRAGRRQPSQQDVASGYQAMAHGATSAQIEAVAQHTPSNRSLSVAFDAMARLEANGATPARATAQLVSSLDANVTDQTLAQLGTSANTSVAGAVTGSSTSATSSVAGSATAATGGVKTGVAGTVGAVVKPPME